jgi:flagellar export protein FliJ
MSSAQRARVARLARIIGYRRRLTEWAQQRLAAESRAVSAAEDALDQLQAHRRELAEDLERLARSPVNPALLESGERYQRWLGGRVRAETSVLEAARCREEEARQHLLVQQREQRKVEKLQARWQLEALRAAQRLNGQQLDEAALTRYRLERSTEGGAG